MRLIVTRPEPQGEATAAVLRARGHDVLLAPMLRIEPVADVDLGAGPRDAVLMTSANAARAIVAHPRRAALAALPVYVVGDKTAEAARAAGFATVVSADGDAADLAGLVAARLPQTSRLLWLAGADHSDLDQVLVAAGFAVDTAVVYRAVATAELPRPVGEALAAGRIDGVLHFSARSAEVWRAAAKGNNHLKYINYCLSNQIAGVLEGKAGGPVRIAPEPTERALLDLVGRP